MGENKTKTFLIILSVPLLLLFAIGFAIGVPNLINIIDGTNAYINGGEDYCLNLFEERYNKQPYEVAINPYGDCVYKLDYIQENYIPLYDLKNIGDKNG